MSPGKMAAQAFQASERLHRCLLPAPHWTTTFECRQAVRGWKKHTTTIARVAKTPAMWERVKAEVEGVVMVDEGYTEVAAGSETCFASWPLLLADVPKILKNSKVPLL